jgi:ribosomal protein S6
LFSNKKMTETHEERDEVRGSYELGFHLVPSLDENDLALRVEELVKMVTQDGGALIAEGYPQHCKLAYTMRKLKSGMWSAYDTSYFGWVRFEADKGAVARIVSALRANEYLIRHLLITLDKKALLAPVAPRIMQGQDGKEVVLEPKALEKKAVKEEREEVVEEELEKELEDLIK